MSDSAVSRRYARALADALETNEAQDKALAELREFEKFFAAEKFTRSHLLDIRAKAGAREKMAALIAQKAGFSKETTNFLKLIAEHGRFEFFTDILRRYAEELDRRRGILRASVASASRLSDAQQKSLADALSKATGKKAALETHEDASLLAGVVVRAGSRVYDASLRAQIRRLAEQLSQS